MSTQYSPKVVTDGLVLALDAGNPKSYVSGSSTWRDLSGNGFNANIGSNVSFVNTGGGGLSFLNSATTANSSITGSTSFSYTNWTWEIIIQTTNTPPATDPTGFFGMYDSSVTSNGFRNGGNYSQFSAGGVWVSTTLSNVIPTSVSVRTITKSGTNLIQYNNGSFYNSGTIGAGTGTITTYAINSISLLSAVNSIDGIVYGLRIYNRTLSSQEVLQNYNATKTRFGL